MSWQNRLDSLRLIQVVLFSAYYLAYLMLLVLTPAFCALRSLRQFLCLGYQSAYILWHGFLVCYLQDTTTNFLTIDGDKYEIQYRNRLDNSQWQTLAITSGRFRDILDTYKDTEYTEYRIKKVYTELYDFYI